MTFLSRSQGRKAAMHSDLLEEALQALCEHMLY